jgi:hypothetical protein
MDAGLDVKFGITSGLTWDFTTVSTARVVFAVREAVRQLSADCSE